MRYTDKNLQYGLYDTKWVTTSLLAWYKLVLKLEIFCGDILYGKNAV